MTEPRCRCCRSRSREALDRAILSGASEREAAVRFGFSKSAVGRHRPHIEASSVDSSAECERAAALLDQFLAEPMACAEDVLAGGKRLLDAQLRFARALAKDNPTRASTIVSRAQGALVELFGRAYKVVGNDAPPASVTILDARTLNILERMPTDALRALVAAPEIPTYDNDARPEDVRAAQATPIAGTRETRTSGLLRIDAPRLSDGEASPSPN